MKTKDEIIFNLRRNESTYKLMRLNYEYALEFLKKNNINIYNAVKTDFKFIDTDYNFKDLNIIGNKNKELYYKCINLISLIGDDFIDILFINRIKDDYISFIKNCSATSQDKIESSLIALKQYLEDALNSYTEYKIFCEESKLKMIEEMSKSFSNKLLN